MDVGSGRALLGGMEGTSTARSGLTERRGRTSLRTYGHMENRMPISITPAEILFASIPIISSQHRQGSHVIAIRSRISAPKDTSLTVSTIAASVTARSATESDQGHTTNKIARKSTPRNAKGVEIEANSFTMNRARVTTAARSIPRNTLAPSGGNTASTQGRTTPSHIRHIATASTSASGGIGMGGSADHRSSLGA